MPNLDRLQSSAVDDAAPMFQPTLIPAERSLSDLYTGGWRRRLSGLPTILGRPLARWAGRIRSALAFPSRHGADQDAARR
jgi:hypothetical protein